MKRCIGLFFQLDFVHQLNVSFYPYSAYMSKTLLVDWLSRCRSKLITLNTRQFHALTEMVENQVHIIYIMASRRGDERSDSSWILRIFNSHLECFKRTAWSIVMSPKNINRNTYAILCRYIFCFYDDFKYLFNRYHGQSWRQKMGNTYFL